MKNGYKSGRWGPFWGYVVHGYPWQANWSVGFRVGMERTLFLRAYLIITVGYWSVAGGLSILKDEKQAAAIRDAVK